MSRATAYIGLGANLGDATVTLSQALKALQASSGICEVQASSFYQSAPVDAPGPTYVNAAARLSTTLAPLPLLAVLRTLEHQFGRERHFRNAPRTLDLDLLLYDQLDFETPSLVVPHPRMHLRAFVIKPLMELGQAETVVAGKPLSDWLAECAEQPCRQL